MINYIKVNRLSEVSLIAKVKFLVDNQKLSLERVSQVLKKDLSKIQRLYKYPLKELDKYESYIINSIKISIGNSKDLKSFILEARKRGYGDGDIAVLTGKSRASIYQIRTYTHKPILIKILEKRERVVREKKELQSDGRNVVREIVRVRDNHTCQICFKKWEKGKRRFDVHHTDEKLEGRSKERGIIKLDKANMYKMITLCHKCHFSIDSVRKKISNGLSPTR